VLDLLSCTRDSIAPTDLLDYTAHCSSCACCLNATSVILVDREPLRARATRGRRITASIYASGYYERLSESAAAVAAAAVVEFRGQTVGRRPYASACTLYANSPINLAPDGTTPHSRDLGQDLSIACAVVAGDEVASLDKNPRQLQPPGCSHRKDEWRRRQYNYRRPIHIWAYTLHVAHAVTFCSKPAGHCWCSSAELRRKEKST